MEDSWLGIFGMPMENDFPAALAWVFSTCQLILSHGTDANREQNMMAKAALWMAQFCVGSDLAANINARLQTLRQRSADSQRRNSAKQEVAELKIICNYARGLAEQKFEGLPLMDLFLRDLNQIQQTLEGWNIEPVKPPKKDVNMAAKYL